MIIDRTCLEVVLKYYIKEIGYNIYNVSLFLRYTDEKVSCCFLAYLIINLIKFILLRELLSSPNDESW